jgi:hypothetical protein
MKNRIITTLTLLVSLNGFAESLKCHETHTFVPLTMSIERSGSDGVHHTYIQLNAAWFAISGFDNLSLLTGRVSDQKLFTTEVRLPFVTQAACTPNNNSVSEDFSCSVEQAQIMVTGIDQNDISDGSIVLSEHITKQLLMSVAADVQAKIQIVDPTRRRIHLTGVIKNTKTGNEIKLDEKMDCKVSE